MYNNATEDRTSLGEVIEVMSALQPGLQVTVSPVTEPPRGSSVLATGPLQRDVGFVPQYDIRSGLQEYLAWRQVTRFAE